MKFIHLTDPHLTSPGVRLYGLDPHERLAGAIDHIARNHADAEFCAVTGDLTHWGEPAAYEALGAILGRLPMPVYPILGNHDDRACFRAQFPDVPVCEGGFVQYAVETVGARLLFLDTLHPGTDAGWCCEMRQAWLEAELQASVGRDVHVFMHHPPFPVGIPMMDRIGVVQAEDVAALLTRHGNVRHIYFGHVHRPISGSFRGIPFSTLYGSNHQVGLELRDASPAACTHEPPTYCVVLVKPDCVLVHTCPYLDASPTRRWDEELD